MRKSGVNTELTKSIEILGQKFHYLTVISYSHQEITYTKSNTKVIKHYYNCDCDCGNSVKVLKGELLAKRGTKSCGCARTLANMQRTLDLQDMVFGKLTVKNKMDNGLWSCVCECGEETSVRTAALRNGNTTSCGCKRAETTSKQLYEKHAARRAEKGIKESEFSRSENEIQRQEFYKFSRKVFERDSFCCAWCSKIGGKLNAHHLDFWSEFPDKRFELSNLITLCRTCHLKVHQNNFFGPPDSVMDILLRGYTKVVEDYSNWCVRVELTPN